jgi:hypothetical protein
VVSVLVLRFGRALSQQKLFSYSFLIQVEYEPQGYIVRLEKLGYIEDKNYFIRYRTHDLLACSIAPQPCFRVYVCKNITSVSDETKEQDEDWRLLGCYDVRLFYELTFRRNLAPPKRLLQEPHGVRSQKTEFFIVTAVRISNLTYY